MFLNLKTLNFKFYLNSLNFLKKQLDKSFFITNRQIILKIFSLNNEKIVDKKDLYFKNTKNIKLIFIFIFKFFNSFFAFKNDNSSFFFLILYKSFIFFFNLFFFLRLTKDYSKRSLFFWYPKINTLKKKKKKSIKKRLKKNFLSSIKNY